MTEFDPAPDQDAIDEVRERWRERTDTFDRVYDTVLGTTEPTSYPDLAKTANCSPNAAKKNLDRLAEMGIARADRDARPTRYECNESFLEWQEANRIADERTVEEIVDRVEALEARRDEFVDRFGTADPSAVSVFDHDDHDQVHRLMEQISDWQAIERDIHLYELVRQISRNDGHLVPLSP